MSETPPGAAPAARPTYWLTRFCILRLLGLVYLVGFLIAALQGMALLGSSGLLPVTAYLTRLETHFGSRFEAFLQVPSLFWIDASDGVLLAAAWAGVALSILLVAGWANAIQLLVLWALYMSFVHVGQDWYSYGWEIQLLETGFLAAFLCPLLDGRPFPRRAPPFAVLVLFRWLAFRIMLGAGLIKIRGDACWRDLTCLIHHYETQPNPHLLSRALHFMPVWFHKGGVVVNHLAELAAPWFVFGPRRARLAAGAFLTAFQGILILSGNLSFLNWLTIVPILACFDDGFLRRVLPRRLHERAARAETESLPSGGQRVAVALLVAVVGLLSVPPVLNLLSPRQAMNTSFNRLNLVNTYGAFGSVGKRRGEIVFEGTDAAVPSDGAAWREYEWKCKPGDPGRRPCLVTPYHYRLDWQIWFAAMSRPSRYPWTVHLVSKLLHNDPGALGLLAGNPFPGAPPRFIRARYYIYEFAPPDDPSGAWWRRTPAGEWLPPLSAEDPRLLAFLAAHGWSSRPGPSD